ncbi:hypothetical protein BLNAU_11972 [Blattamonas nauphoetae]|uniref:Uncharacterized protein n=1 Tax=Blattamonas nauphoetae TaxID=2049346 RepID=A0ABQ9XNR2_9EUKA|nr:hypothetical protein BLNAU_11972 [Blattamonas nauphoetae]
MDCSPFLNWDESRPETDDERAFVFRSLVATVNEYPPLDVSLEAKAVKLLESVDPLNPEAADAFLCSLGRTTDESLTNFVQSIVVLLSSPNQAIINASMEMLETLILISSNRFHLALVKADLLPQIVISLNPQSLSFAEAEDIHIYLLKIISWTIWLSTPNGLANMEIEDENEQQAVHETVLKQVVAPSEQYIWHLCMNRFSIVDGDQSWNFMILLTRLLEISPYHQPTMEIVLHMPVILTIPSCLTFFDFDEAIYWFLREMNTFQGRWKEEGRKVREMGQRVTRMLRMEGFEDVIEEKLQNDQKKCYGEWIVDKSIELTNFLGMNLG